ncbi:uncharacterized protein LOC101858761 [Aplysia californica]|uniref:Uncharacterized protein LOC101858761 n=1 Tax=Aplysia californica TaxID=6500 RepID=A0ABM1VY20_APLCA|nr:uncharacterized protein LOC101858761 [Aplysia californica]XP_005090518.1 uncharacterized protein LOC101858761 [Aplysia californica]XP_035827313.1 uncharacterized protein LOC101858761 [Aplysia californica]
MTHLEMRNFDMHYDPEDAEMSAQERLLFNNNFNNNHHHHQHPQQHLSGSGEEENQYQVPYAHLHQHQYLQHQQQLQHQQMPGMYSGSGGSSSDGRHGTFRPSTPRMNGNHHSPVPHHHSGNSFHDKYSVAYPVREDHLGRHSNRSNGSGIVYRPRRKLWWMAAMLVLFLLLVAGAVVIAIYFTVLKKEAEPQETVGGTVMETDDGHTPQTSEEEFVTKQPPYNFPNLGTTPHPPRGSFFPSFSDTKVQKFDAYWHPGDSRLFVASLTNGTVIQVFGPKKSDGTVKSLYSLSMSGADGMVRSVRFLGQRNLASVVLPSGVIVSYDWSANMLDMEIKVFEPYTEGTLGPISHLALVEVGVRSYLLRQISKVMTDLRTLRKPLFDRRRGSTKCFSRFPVMVTKCGGQYPYDGAFVQGEITGIETPITMAALPWPKEADPCYAQESGSVSNYYLPLPGQVDDDNATMIKDAYTASSARLFTELCNIINDQVYQERQNLCSDMADKVAKKLKRQRVYSIIYDSCSAILNSLHTACVAISGIASSDNMPSLTENGLMRSLNRRLSDSFQPGLPDQVDLKAHAFCPSSLPLSSYQSTVAIHAIRGNVAQDVIHINCPDYPEVTKVDLDHLLTTSEVQSSASHYDLVKHKMTVCSICAFEKSVHAKIVYDEMICNNTCSKNNMAEIIPDVYVREGKEFLKQDSVYCHDFLTAVDNRMEPLGRQCVANCMSHLHVKFLIRDPASEVVYYDQTVQCSELRSHSCKMKFGR